jgi:hypothetical protein
MKSMMVHFSIQGEFITERARELWEEGEYKQAMDVMGCLIGSTLEQQISIIEGRAKLIGVNDLDLVSDDWTPPEGYATFSEMLALANGGAELERRRMEEAEDKARSIADIALKAARGGYRSDDELSETRILTAQIHKLIGKAKGNELIEHITAEKIAERDEIDRGRNLADIHRDRFMGRYESEEEANMFEPLESADRMLERMAFVARFTMASRMRKAGLDPTALAEPAAIIGRGYDRKPVIDKKFEHINGWVLPNGDFYGFGAMEHAGQAAQLLPEEVTDPEKEATARGWIKLARSISGFHCIGGDKKPTKKQLNTLFDYAQKHGRDYEEMIERLKQ